MGCKKQTQNNLVGAWRLKLCRIFHFGGEKEEGGGGKDGGWREVVYCRRSGMAGNLGWLGVW